MCVQRNTVARSRNYCFHGNATIRCIVAVPVAVNNINFQTATMEMQQCHLSYCCATMILFTHCHSLPFFWGAETLSIV
jgi:hypothetical protein